MARAGIGETAVALTHRRVARSRNASLA